MIGPVSTSLSIICTFSFVKLLYQPMHLFILQDAKNSSAELPNLLASPDVITTIHHRRMRWVGQVE